VTAKTISTINCGQAEEEEEEQTLSIFRKISITLAVSSNMNF